MPDSSERSAPAVLVRLDRSRLLAAWWLALHGLVGLSLIMTNPVAAVLGAPLVAWHAAARRPARPPLLVVSGRRFALPAEGRFDLALTPRSRAGSLWLSLSFDDCPGRPLLVLRDQLDAAGWRRLNLAVAESG